MSLLFTVTGFGFYYEFFIVVDMCIILVSKHGGALALWTLTCGTHSITVLLQSGNHGNTGVMCPRLHQYIFLLDVYPSSHVRCVV